MLIKTNPIGTEMLLWRAKKNLQAFCFKSGFTSKIVATERTRKLCTIVANDKLTCFLSANLVERFLPQSGLVNSGLFVSNDKLTCFLSADLVERFLPQSVQGNSRRSSCGGGGAGSKSGIKVATFRFRRGQILHRKTGIRLKIAN